MNGTFNPRALNYGRLPRAGIIDPSRMGRMAPQMPVAGGSMRQGVISTPTMREAIMQTQPTQSVAEILSEPLGEITPNLGAATSAASRQRQIADMLMQGAMAQDNTSIAGGLSQLGQAFLARRAGQKAETAEDKQREIASLLMQQAMGEGPESQAARAQLFANNPAAMVAQSDAQRATQAEQQRTQMQNEMLANLFPEGSQQRAMLLAGVGTTEAAKQAFAPQAPQERWEQIEAPPGMPGFYERSTLTGETRQVAGPPDAGVIVNAGDVVAGDRPIVDKPTKGYQRAWDKEAQTYRDVPIPGSPDAVTREEEAYREYMKLQTSEFNYDNVTNEIDRAIKLTDYSTAGVGGAILRELPMTSARTLNNAITMVKSNLGFDRLQQMREESKTGGALGAVTEKEIDLLQSTVQRLDQLTDPQELIRALQVVKEQYIKVQTLRQQMYAMKYSGAAPGQSRPTPGASTSVTTSDLPPGFEMIP